MENFLFLNLFIIRLFVTMILYRKFVNKFPIKWWMSIISFLVPTVSIIYTNYFTLEFFVFCIIQEVLLILAFTDILYFEIDKKSYWLLLVLSFIMFINNALYPEVHLLDVAICPLIMYLIFWIFDKIFGIEKLGGADVKLMLILSFYYPATDIFSFVIVTFGISTILFIIYAIKQKGIKNVQVPMIVGIALSFFIQEAYLIG